MQEGMNDIRTDATKSGGCCPAGLYGGGLGSKGLTGDKGKNCSISKEIGSSVNLKSGNLYHSQDIGGLNLSYNSIDTINSVLGKKWTHSFNLKISTVSSTALAITTESGDINYLQLNGSVYIPEALSGTVSQTVKELQWNIYQKPIKTAPCPKFDANGNLTSITDRNGNTTTLTYSSGVLASITDKNGRTTTITSTGGLITAVTDPMGRTYTLTYTSGLITSIADPLNNSWSFTYDTSGRMLTKDRPARKCHYLYLRRKR